MRYLRYILAPSTYNPHEGQFVRVSHVFNTPDGKVLWKVDLHDEQFDGLDAVPAEGYVFPSLNAPVDKLPTQIQTWLSDMGVTADPGDTVLNALRKVRQALGIPYTDLRIEAEI